MGPLRQPAGPIQLSWLKPLVTPLSVTTNQRTKKKNNLILVKKFKPTVHPLIGNEQQYEEFRPKNSWV